MNRYHMTEFDRSIRMPELDDPNHPQYANAAYRLAVAIGECHMRGLEPDGMGVMPSPMATAAVQAALAHLDELPESYWDVTTAFDGDNTPTESDEHVVTVVAHRHDLYALGIAAQQSFELAVSANDADCRALAAACELFWAKMAVIDVALQRQRDVVSIVTASGWYHATRSELAGEWRECPPWWLRIRPTSRAFWLRLRPTSRTGTTPAMDTVTDTVTRSGT